MENRYPRLEINLAHLQHNVSRIVEKCGSCGIQVAGVIKGATGHPEVAKAFDKGGAAFIASSRLEQIEDARENFTKSYSWPTWEILEKASGIRKRWLR